MFGFGDAYDDQAGLLIFQPAFVGKTKEQIAAILRAQAGGATAAHTDAIWHANDGAATGASNGGIMQQVFDAGNKVLTNLPGQGNQTPPNSNVGGGYNYNVPTTGASFLQGTPLANVDPMILVGGVVVAGLAAFLLLSKK